MVPEPPTGQPFRARHGARNGHRAPLRARHGARNGYPSAPTSTAGASRRLSDDLLKHGECCKKSKSLSSSTREHGSSRAVSGVRIHRDPLRSPSKRRSRRMGVHRPHLAMAEVGARTRKMVSRPTHATTAPLSEDSSAGSPSNGDLHGASGNGREPSRGGSSRRISRDRLGRRAVQRRARCPRLYEYVGEGYVDEEPNAC